MLSIAVRVCPLLASLSMLPHGRTKATIVVDCGSAVGILEGAYGDNHAELASFRVQD